MVYYRKYRPQTIADLDLASVRERLTSILSSKDIPHAFLFTGPRGLGKTSSARIVAKAINCEKKIKNPISKISHPVIEPCNNCDICVAITNGSHIDVIEIDAASNRGVDEIRSLREKVKFSPSELSKKVYIIDEVHMLTTEAFNALLKTLEEPPEHVVFILATTEAHKVPQTILSRTFQVKFETPTKEEVLNSLKRIIDGEKIKVDDKDLEKISDLSEGSFRDAAKILEDLSLSGNGKITSEIIEKIYKTGTIEVGAVKLLSEIRNKNMEKSIEIINESASAGVDFRVLIEKMVERIRADLIEGKGDVNVHKETLKSLNEAYSLVKISVVPQLPLEIAVIELSLMANGKWQMDNKESVVVDGKRENDPPSTISHPLSDAKSVDSSGGQDFLKDLIAAVHTTDKRVAAFLRSCKEANVDESNLVLVTPFSIHAQKLETPEFREIILKSVFDIDPKIKDLVIKVA